MAWFRNSDHHRGFSGSDQIVITSTRLLREKLAPAGPGLADWLLALLAIPPLALDLPTGKGTSLPVHLFEHCSAVEPQPLAVLLVPGFALFPNSTNCHSTSTDFRIVRSAVSELVTLPFAALPPGRRHTTYMIL